MTVFDEAFSQLTTLTNWEVKKPGSRHRIDLSGTEGLLARLQNPERELRCVAQVAGSKGKGTTVSLLAGMARAGGLRSGSYMSPHVVDPRERIRVDGMAVDELVFADAVRRVREVVIPEQTWYEAYTAVAILCFAALDVDCAVLEVGLGGRLDATSVVPKKVCAITGIELEHTHVLGDSIEAITREKAGILREGVPCISGCQGTARDVLLEMAARVGAPIRLAGRDFDVRVAGRSSDGFQLEFEGFGGLRTALVPLRAEMQVPSFAYALAMLEELDPGVAERLFGDGPRRSKRASGLAWVTEALPPGRFDIVQDDPPIVIDGAHTDASLKAFASELEAHWPGRRFGLVFGIAQGKHFREGLGRLLAVVDKARVVPLDGKASVPTAELAQIMASHGVVAEECDSVRAALESLFPLSDDDGICVTGSLYAAGDALRTFRSATD